MFFVKSFSDFGFDGTGFCLKTHITYYVEHLCAAVPFSPSLFCAGHKPATLQLWQLKKKNRKKKRTKRNIMSIISNGKIQLLSGTGITANLPALKMWPIFMKACGP